MVLNIYRHYRPKYKLAYHKIEFETPTLIDVTILREYINKFDEKKGKSLSTAIVVIIMLI